ncbi:MAG: hypothetical protein KAX44_01540 [Candidatus Brocadiae bacterium]|nr:hypothetical protein [Candidatus Brocadiia bacterium]
MRTTMALVCLLAFAAGAASAQDGALRMAWTWRSGDRSKLLEEASARLDKLVRRWPKEQQLREAPEKDADVQWMRQNRYATHLVVDSGLAQRPAGARRSVLLYLTRKLHRRSLGRYLPGLLDSCTTTEEYLEVLSCMAAVRDRTSLRALNGFLLRPPKQAKEQMLLIAIMGLGLSGDVEYLATINLVRQQFKAPAFQFEGAKAAWRCGDETALYEAARFLENAEVQFHDSVIAFLREAFCEESLELLADLAKRTENDELACAIIQTIIEATRYGEPLVEEEEKLAEPPPPDVGPLAQGADTLPEGQEPKNPSRAAAPSGLEKDVSELTVHERQELLEKVLAWWEAEGRALAEERRNMPQEA